MLPNRQESALDIRNCDDKNTGTVFPGGETISFTPVKEGGFWQVFRVLPESALFSFSDQFCFLGVY
jgi:hypothetical protein